jgi:hypothetical protein
MLSNINGFDYTKRDKALGYLQKQQENAENGNIKAQITRLKTDIAIICEEENE